MASTKQGLAKYFSVVGGSSKTKIPVVEDNINGGPPSKVSTIPWVEKYRPKRVDDLVFQDEVVSVLKNCVNSNGADLPNLLFYGPPGTGKTSAAVALCRQLFKTPELYKQRVLELNASDERGIDVVRHRIKDWSRQTVVKTAGGKVPALKIVMLDEADAMTKDAQSALRRTMEAETASTRFIIICNYITRIIEPLTSRCSKFQFKPLTSEVQKGRLVHIANIENVQYDEDAFNTLQSVSGGDLRKAITLFQTLASAGIVTSERVQEASGYVPIDEITRFLKAIRSGRREDLLASVHGFVRQGFAVSQLIQQLADRLLEDDENVEICLGPLQLVKIFNKIAICEKRLLDGADEMIQLYDLFATLSACYIDQENTNEQMDTRD